MDKKRDSPAENSILTLSGSGSAVEQIRNLVPAARAAAFWGAVCLPWIALFLLFTGVATRYPVLFTLVVAAAFVAAIAGHNHTRR